MIKNQLRHRSEYSGTDDLPLKGRYLTPLVFLLFLVSIFINPAFSQEAPFDPYSQDIPGSEQIIKMVPITGGTFMMGSTEDEVGREEDEGPPQKVKVDSFWMGTHEITWAQYDLFVEENIHSLREQLEASSDIDIDADAVSTPTPPYVDMSFGMGRDGYPAASMTQYAAVMFAKWLTAKTGNFYRLPTEAEWEYACRTGESTAFSFGNDVSELDKYGWYKGNSNSKYQQVGTKAPNKWGLYDMHGNVAEWTMDQYYKDYFNKLEGEIADNPVFIPEELYPRSLRGGSWSHDAEDLRCAARQGSDPNWKVRDPQLPKSRWWYTSRPFFGFRLIRPQDQPSQAEMEKYWIDAIEDY